jgi:TonB-linked SusC/RagA family outer membrane protein
MRAKIIKASCYKISQKGFLILVLMSIQSYLNAQITVDATNKTLKEIIKVIENTSEYRFFYNESLSGIDKIQSLQVKNASIEKTMSILLEGTEISYKRETENIVVLIPQNRSSLVDKKKIACLVTDSIGEPIVGATVIIKGSDVCAITNIDGFFSMEVPLQAQVNISSIGFKKKILKIGAANSYIVTLEEDVEKLEEIVVVGYGTQKKINVTGAVSTVDLKVLESRPITNLGEGLQGTIANLNITQTDGSLGRTSIFNVRGFTSINGGSPLILVNGVPMDIDMLNPNDFDQISVLKDAASSAIYGASGAYGVILISTKSGKKGKIPKVSLSANYAVNKPTVEFSQMDAMERMRFLDFGSNRANGNNYYSNLQRNAITAHYNNPTQPETFIDPASPLFYSYSANTNWAREILRDSYPMQQYNASISGGSDKFTYYNSVSYLSQKGIAKHFDETYKRFNLMSNLSYDLTNWLNIGTKISINNSDKMYPPDNNYGGFPENALPFSIRANPIMPIYNPDGTYASDGANENLVNMHKAGGYRTRTVNDVWMTYTAKITPIKNVVLNFDYSSGTNLKNEMSYWREMPLYDTKGNVAGYHTFTYPNSVQKMIYSIKNEVFNTYMEYENKLGKHKVKAILGFNQESTIKKYFMAGRQNLIKDESPYMSLASGEDIVADASTEIALRGGFARFNYNYAERYLMEFNGRYDGSSKFPKNDRFVFFPSLSLGWRVDNESFFSGLKQSVNMLKLRISYGSLGNQDVASNYPYLATYSSLQPYYIFGGQLPMAVSTPGLASPILTWETVAQQNIGIDIGLFGNKLNVTFDTYRRDTKNMLTKSETLPALLGTAVPQSNAGDLKTIGFDLSIDWKQTIDVVTYGVTLLLSDNTSEITKYSNPQGLLSDYYVGQKVGDIWGLETGGFFKTDADAQSLDQTQISGRKRFAGDIYFNDLNGDGKITRGTQTLNDHGDMKVIGNNTPRYSFGIKPYISWKGFDFVVIIQGVAKRDTWLATDYFLTGYVDEWMGISKVVTDYWTPENTDAYFPAPVFRVGTDVTAVQSHFLQNSAYIRLKQLTVGYTIPNNLTKKINIERLKLYFSGKNLWTATKMLKVVDPEMITPAGYPVSSTVSFGMNIDF